MNDALYIAATGMQAQQLGVDTIANNIANAATPGFKRSRVNFQDLMSRQAGVDPSGQATAESGVGSGVGVASLLKFFDAGDLSATGNPLDLAIRGDGFIEVQQADGSTAYWRGGSLKVTPEGWLATSQGQLLKPQIQVGKDIKALSITDDGKVTVRSAAGNDMQVGQIELHAFANPTGLLPLGDGTYRPSEDSGDPSTATPGSSGLGNLQQGYAEQSNVHMVDEMVNLMMAQRAYEMNVKVIQAADEMLGMSNNLRK